MSLIYITEQLVEEKLETLKVNKSPGPDDIHPKSLFELKSIIAKPVAKLFNMSLQSGVIPDNKKNANATPLYKKGSKADVKNYRPVILTLISCKILETIIKHQINKHLNKYKLINENQHDFSTGKSC